MQCQLSARTLGVPVALGGVTVSSCPKQNGVVRCTHFTYENVHVPFYVSRYVPVVSIVSAAAAALRFVSDVSTLVCPCVNVECLNLMMS